LKCERDDEKIRDGEEGAGIKVLSQCGSRADNSLNMNQGEKSGIQYQPKHDDGSGCKRTLLSDLPSAHKRRNWQHQDNRDNARKAPEKPIKHINQENHFNKHHKSMIWKRCKYK